MLLAVGWFVVGVARPAYRDASFEDLDVLDESYDAQDEQLWDALEVWLKAHTDGFMQWKFQRRFNNHRGLLQVSVSRNHRASSIWDLLKWLSQSEGTYGLMHVHDDEDERTTDIEGMGAVPNFNAFKVWCLKRSVLTEHTDNLLSPIVPLLQDAAD
jgi:hypothetical protein